MTPQFLKVSNGWVKGKDAVVLQMVTALKRVTQNALVSTELEMTETTN